MTSKVHRVRYYNPKPEPIICICFNKSSKLIAVARSDASIEIWDLNFAPLLVKFIPGVENGSVEALAWVNERLMSTGLGGALVEWDLDKLCIKTTALLTGYAAWCLDVNYTNMLLAVGTEQGYINLYSVDNNEIVYKRIFDKQEGRIMCCKFEKSGNILVTGSINTIRIWNVETGHVINRISVSRRGKDTIVWCLAVLSDNVIVSGDSYGKLTFWDSAMGDQIEAYTTHKADVLTLAVSDDEKSIYCSGVDPVIMNFIKVNNNKQSKMQWVKNVQRHIHEHDVRALVLNGDQLISVGADGYLTFSSFPPKWVMRMPAMIPSPRSSVCPRKKILLLRYSNNLEVWKLGSYATSGSGKVMFTNINTKESANNKENNKHLEQDSALSIINKANIKNNKQQSSLKLTENPVKLVSIQTKGKKQIRCCEMSPRGEFIVYSTECHLRMLKLDVDFDDDKTSASVSKVMITGVSAVCNRVAFTEDSRLMVVHSAGLLQTLVVDPEAGATVVQSIMTDKYLKTLSVLHLLISSECSSGSTYLVVGDTQGAIAIWTRKGNKFDHYATLPKYRCVPSAMTVDSKQENLVVTYTDQKIVEYELVSKKFLEWPRISLPPEWTSRKSAVTSISAHPQKDAFVFQDDTSLWILDKSQVDREEPSAKKKSQANTVNIDLRIIPIKYLAGFHWVGPDEAVTLEVLPQNIVSQLGPTVDFRRNYMA